MIKKGDRFMTIEMVLQYWAFDGLITSVIIQMLVEWQPVFDYIEAMIDIR